MAATDMPAVPDVFLVGHGRTAVLSSAEVAAMAARRGISVGQLKAYLRARQDAAMAAHDLGCDVAGIAALATAVPVPVPHREA